MSDFIPDFERFFFDERKMIEMHFSASERREENEKQLAERAKGDANLLILPDERVLRSILPLYPDIYAKLIQ